MIEVTLQLEGYLKDKYPLSYLELNYSKPITIRQVLKDAKISSADVFFIKVEDLIVKEDYLLTKSNEVKLFPITGGGIERIRNLINYGVLLPKRSSRGIL